MRLGHEWHVKRSRDKRNMAVWVVTLSNQKILTVDERGAVLFERSGLRDKHLEEMSKLVRYAAKHVAMA